MTDQVSSFQKVASLIKSRQNFALARFGDGEIQIMRDKKLRGIDGWISDGQPSLLRTQLRALTKIRDNGIFFGIACKCHFPEDNAYIRHRLAVPSERIVTSNVFVNSTYPKSASLIRSLKDNSLFFVSKKYAQLDRSLYIKHEIDRDCVHPVFDKDCFAWWNQSFRDVFEYIKEATARQPSKKYILMAGGPMASVLSILCFRENTNRTWLDVGSALDSCLFGVTNRPYQITGHSDQLLNCII